VTRLIWRTRAPRWLQALALSVAFAFWGSLVVTFWLVALVAPTL